MPKQVKTGDISTVTTHLQHIPMKGKGVSDADTSMDNVKEEEQEEWSGGDDYSYSCQILETIIRFRDEDSNYNTKAI